MIQDRVHAIGFVERVAVWLLLLILTLALVHGDWLWRWDQLLYDAQLRLWRRPAPDDVVIVAIDESSLNAIGRWPWPRDVHARLIARLTEEQARGIAMDVIMAEPSTGRPEADAALAEALQRNGRTVLPVLAERSHPAAPLRETLPIPTLAAKAAALATCMWSSTPTASPAASTCLRGWAPHAGHI